ncbi:MAG: periplasmic heavy metal sensor [Armatimonadetes bacterium]|nr:periplasmic heavy metal sensor [Armatimonadota bacterium]
MLASLGRLPLLMGALLLCLLLAPALAQEEGGDLGFSQEQREKLREIHARYEKKRQEIRIALQEKRLDLMKLVQADSPDKETIKTKMREILTVEGRRQELFVDEIFEAKATMTAAQFQVYRQKVLKRMLELREGRGKS